MCSLNNPACNAHAPYGHVCPAPLHNIFPDYFINGMIFGKKKVTEHKTCVLIFSTVFIRHISHSKMKWARYNKKRKEFMFSTCYSCPILMETLIFFRVFRKILKISRKSVQWGPRCSMRMDGQTNMMKLIVTLHNFAHTPKNKLMNSW